MNQSVIIFFVCLVISFAQKSQPKGAPEMMQPMMYENDNSELLAKVSSQLLSALANIENMQEGEDFYLFFCTNNKMILMYY
uniref:Secreted protein n=1 Tax=Heterorhabditis bacteriophora TaxID=37862 RepID=A0A1I7XN04_HETBA